MRLDAWLVERGHFESRARAQAAIKAGLVRLNNAVIQKPSQKVASDDSIDVVGDVHPFVSRGGVKLQAALRAFDVDPAGLICLDLGASTGGFTDLLLREGALKIYAVDVGIGQLHSSIASDPRVINLEKTHVDRLDRSLVPDDIQLMVCDVSFISLKRALPNVLSLAAPVARLIALVKPQFEVGPSNIGKGGIVKPGTDLDAIPQEIGAWIDAQPKWNFDRFMDSPIAGGDGNREFLLAASRTT